MKKTSDVLDSKTQAALNKSIDTAKTKGYEPIVDINRSENEKQSAQLDLVALPRKVSGAELFARNFAPLNPIIDNLLYRGHLGILAGKPKIGKSWLFLQMAQAIDTGKPFLGRSTHEVRILYCALEDGERRIHERMRLRNWRPTSEVDFIFNILPFDGEGISQLRGLAKDKDLIFIDTLIATLTRRIKESDNTQMGEILNQLALFAHETDKTIVLSHHMAKADTEDSFDAIRGASAIRAAYDVGFILQRRHNELEALLRMEARDIDSQDMTIKFDVKAGWTYLGDSNQYDDIKAGKNVVRALRNLGDSKTVKEIAQFLSITEQSVHNQLSRAKKEGLVTQSKPKMKTGHKPADLWSLI